MLDTHIIEIMENSIEVQGLTHAYGDRTALENISFNVQKGEVFALLGPNGAGKTTTIRLLNGLFSPTAGQMCVLGMDPVARGDEVRRQCGVLTETPALYERLTAVENLQFFGTLAGLPAALLKDRITEWMAFFDLSQRSRERVANFSKGMKQRLALARAFLHNPQVVFLDEPTSGLDPEAAQQVHELIQTIRSHNGQTILLSTHHLFEAERLCDRVAILNHGRLLACGSVESLRRRYFPAQWLQIDFLAEFNPQSISEISSLAGVLLVQQPAPLSLKLQVLDDSVIPNVISCLVSLQAPILAVKPLVVSLEEIYFKLQQESIP